MKLNNLHSCTTITTILSKTHFPQMKICSLNPNSTTPGNTILVSVFECDYTSYECNHALFVLFYFLQCFQFINALAWVRISFLKIH